MKPNVKYAISGEKCKARRLLLGLTQSQIAEAAEMMVAHYARFEQVKRMNPTVDTAGRLANALGCSIDNLLA